MASPPVITTSTAWESEESGRSGRRIFPGSYALAPSGTEDVLPSSSVNIPAASQNRSSSEPLNRINHIKNLIASANRLLELLETPSAENDANLEDCDPTEPTEDQMSSAEQGTSSQSAVEQHPDSLNPSSSVLGELLDEVMSINECLQPHLVLYHEVMRDQCVYRKKSRKLEDAQRLCNLVPRTMHYISHVYHNLSDLSVDVTSAPPRRIQAPSGRSATIIQQTIPVLQAEISLSGGPLETASDALLNSTATTGSRAETHSSASPEIQSLMLQHKEMTEDLDSCQHQCEQQDMLLHDLRSDVEALRQKIAKKLKFTAEEMKLNQEEADFYQERLGFRMKSINSNMDKETEYLNMNTNNPRETPEQRKRREDSVTMGYKDALIPPIYWQPTNIDMSTRMIELANMTQDYRRATDYLAPFIIPDIHITKLESIENLEFFQAYGVKQIQMETKNGMIQNERILFHGAPAHAVKKIVQMNFSRSYSFTKNAQATYGHGVNFAVEPGNAMRNKYAAEQPGSHLQQFFVCKVLVGRYADGNSKMYEPPMSSDGCGYFDSTVDCANDPSIFVVYRDNQVYPMYLVTFLLKKYMK